jgi:hypothetical protein
VRDLFDRGARATRNTRTIVRRPDMNGWLRCVTILGLVCLCAASSGAEDVQQWHWWTNEIGLHRKFTVILHGQNRTRRPLGEFWQARLGPIGMYTIRPRAYLVGGYYYRREGQPLEPGIGDSHRYFGGIQQYSFLPETRVAPPLLLESRGLMERFAGGPAGTRTNFNRKRYRARLTIRDRAVSPLLGYEIFFDRHGLWANRPHGGVRWTPNPRVMLDIGYYWDGRTARVGQTRHLFFTNLLLKLRQPKDPDFPDRPTF